MTTARTYRAAGAVLIAALLILLGWVIGRNRHSTPHAPITSAPPSSIPGAEISDVRSIRVFDTDVPFGSGRVPPGRFRWPVKPFDRPHELRATFGEPRGLLDAGISAQGATRARMLTHADQLLPIGRRVIHTGIDIVATDGTPVYAVESGVARTGGATWDQFVVVGSYGYWHLKNPVPSGTGVTAFQTVIGTVYPGQEHVHLTRFSRPGGLPVNPLLAGGIQPYTDTAPPEIDGVQGFDPTGRPVPLSALQGPVVLSVQAADVQSTGGTRVGLYRIGYSIVPRAGGPPIVGPIESFRFDVLPSQSEANVSYTLDSTRHRFSPTFWYRITDRSPSDDGFLQCASFPPGDYSLIVTAADARDNTATRTFPITILR